MNGQWVKALRPGWLGKKFYKAGDIFQLTDQDAFSDKWMEKHEAPKDVAPTREDVEKEQKDAVREHEETDRIRRGKFSTPSVPRSPESVEAQEKQKREDRARQVRERDAEQASRRPEKAPAAPPAQRPAAPAPRPAPPASPPPIDRGSADPHAPGGVHETSANPSRVDENARR
jgi:hypothetical protein